MVDGVKFDVDPQKKLQSAIEQAIKDIADLTVPYKLMARSWFKGNKSIFDSGRQGPGKYDDLDIDYKKQKKKKYGHVYPILKASGKIESSVTNPSDPNSVNYIINKKYLFLGTKATTVRGAPYAIFLQKGTKRGMPARPYVLIGAEQVADQVQNKRLEAWVETIQSYVIDKLASVGKVSKI